MIARWFGLPVGMIGLAVVVGCWSDDGLEARYAVSGTVTYQGKPLKRGSIAFIPANQADRGATGSIQEDGTYTLTTNTPNDGAFPGKYKVTIADLAVDIDAVKAAMKKQMAKSGARGPIAEGTIDPAMAAKFAKKAKSNVPIKYTKTATTTLSADVKTENNTIDFELTD